MQKVINDFIEAKHIAIAGVSRTTKGKWGNSLMKELSNRGYTVYPVNPNTEDLEGVKCYRNVKSLPPEVKSLIIATKPDACEQLVKDAKEAGLNRVWMQKSSGKGSATTEAIQFCKENNLDYIYGICPMMGYGKGPHKFHFWIRKTFGGLPAEMKK
jgi:uncharacterized protein